MSAEERVTHRPAGWGFPGSARKAHYFPADDLVALCKRWMYAGPREPETGQRSRDDCTACVKALARDGAR